MMDHILSILYFILAGLCEIGGGYLIWLCIGFATNRLIAVSMPLLRKKVIRPSF
jgi:small multidrug resistance family-3 protein